MQSHVYYVQVLYPVIYRKMFEVKSDSQSAAEREAIEQAKDLSKSDYELSVPVGYAIECTYVRDLSAINAEDTDAPTSHVDEIPSPRDAMGRFEYGLLQADKEVHEGRLLATPSLLKIDPAKLVDLATDWNGASFTVCKHAVQWVLAKAKKEMPNAASDHARLEQMRKRIYSEYRIDPKEQKRMSARLSAEGADELEDDRLVVFRAIEKQIEGVDG